MRARPSMVWMLGWLTLLAGCGGPAPIQGVGEEEAGFVSLMELEPVRIEIPSDSRGGLAPAPEIPLAGPWRHRGTTPSGRQKWAMDIPVRPRGLFFQAVEPGMVLRDRSGRVVPYGRAGAGEGDFWTHDRKVLVLFRAGEEGPPPGLGDYVFSYDKAVERERALNLAFQPEGTQPWDFVRTSIHHDWNTRTGLLIPAPGTLSWELDLPPSAELLMAPGLNRPEWLDGPRSDGATLVVRLEAEGQEHELERFALEPGVFTQTRVDLSPWSGKRVRLTLHSDPGPTENFDYVFVGDPMVASRKANPRRVLMVFIDTLRADHLGLYGYERETSVKLDRWAQEAAVFEHARSVAPWTLPTGRTLVTGRHPEHYHDTETLQQTLRREGFLSAMIAGNVYLSNNFEMARDWGWHSVGMFPRAKAITDDALAWLEATRGHDVLLQVHYMDPHLPYLEPKTYRRLFAGPNVAGLGEEFYLPEVRRAPATDELREYLIGRYDNNIRYATDQAVRLIAEAADADDVVLVYADHGEEFWDHGGFEHGHQLYDELLHVPLIVKAPGVTGRRVREPASLLDVTPTILDALGIEPAGPLDGVSLLPAARGEPGGTDPMVQRDLAFGRPLYGEERWGVLTRRGGSWQKWMTFDGQQEAYDVLADPGETKDLLRGKPPSEATDFHEALGRALGTTAGVAYRLNVGFARNPADRPLILEMEVPGGVAARWVEHDPLGRARAEVSVQVPTEVPEGEEVVHTVVVTVPPGSRGQATVWVVPVRPLAEVTPGIRVHASLGDQTEVLQPPPGSPADLDGRVVWLASRSLGHRVVRLGFGITAVPPEGFRGVVAVDDEMSEELAAIGYQHDDED